jgi:pterin-4a-carbinolamine dehydratase
LSLLNYLVESNNKVSQEDLQSLSKNFKSIVKSNPDNDLVVPINPRKVSEWEVLSSPERLKKIYTFERQEECEYFFNELFSFQFQINHHCKIIIDNLDVTVETYTHGFEGITDPDLKIKSYCDELIGDIYFFKKHND